MTKEKDNLLFLAAAVILCSALLFFAHLGIFTRYMADDYCVAGAAKNSNHFEFVKGMYYSWTGRFSYLLFSYPLSRLGPSVLKILPAFTILIWTVPLTLTVRAVLQSVGANKKNPTILSVIISTTIILTSFSMTPGLFQVLYWRDGLLNYLFPIVGLSMITFILLEVFNDRMKANHPLTLFLFFTLCFFNSGFAEAYTTTQFCFFGLLVLISIFFKRQDLLKLSLIGLIATGIGLVIEAFAPGNQVRAESIDYMPQPIMRVFFLSIRNTIHVFGRHVIFNPLWMLLLGGSAIAVSLIFPDTTDTSIKKGVTPLLFSFSGVFILITACCFPVAYMLNAFPDDRILFIPTVVLNGFLFYSITYLFVFLRSHFFVKDNRDMIKTSRTTLLLFSICLFLAILSTIYLKNLSYYKDYANRWDRRENKIIDAKTNGFTEVVVNGLESREYISDISAQATFWVNSCMANYYDLEAIIGK